MSDSNRGAGRAAAVTVFLMAIRAALPVSAQEQAALESPLPHQVVQREGFTATSPGFATVPLAGRFPDVPGAAFQYRVVPLQDAFGGGTEWAPCPSSRTGKAWSGSARVPAGGWYRLELRCLAGGQTVASASVEPFGVGELFLIAGQSYAEATGDAYMRVEDPQERVVLYNFAKRRWDVAHDPPQDIPIDREAKVAGGTLWVPMANALLPRIKVPIAFVNVAAGGTASREWLPGTKLHGRLASAGKELGRFRAVLWQQGESDVIEKVSTETYVRHLTEIRSSAVREWSFEPPWLAAKSTLHPLVYKDPQGEGRIRAAIDQLWKTPGFAPGPDTDTLTGKHRSGANRHELGAFGHFSAEGQQAAGRMWAEILGKELEAIRAK